MLYFIILFKCTVLLIRHFFDAFRIVIFTDRDRRKVSIPVFIRCFHDERNRIVLKSIVLGSNQSGRTIPRECY